MMANYNSEEIHKPVMLANVMAALQPKNDGLYLDGTLGLGGHAKAILESGRNSRMCGLDRDPEALKIARNRLEQFGSRVNIFHLAYSEFQTALESLGWHQIDGAFLDLGISSLQLDTPWRGFSFNLDGPLDMRMDQLNSNPSAWHFVNTKSLGELKNCIATYGEEPLAGRIARCIVEERQKHSIDDTTMLAKIICNAYPVQWRKKSRRHPATRTFQAIRIAVNDELGQLRFFLDNILKWLSIGGRLAIISFHSLEDRIIKHRMRDWARDCICPINTTKCICGHHPEVRILHKKPVTPSIEELRLNPRASSAKLRVIEKIANI